jgi:MFS family permease
MGLAGLNVISYSLLFAAVPLHEVRSGLGTSAAGVPTTVMLVATIATQPHLPRLLARFGTGTVQAAGLAALGLSALLFLITPDLALVVAASVFRGMGFASLTVVSGVLGSVLAPADRHGESVGLVGLATSISSLVCVPAGVALTQTGHFDLVVLFSAVPVLGVGIARDLDRAPRRALAVTSTRLQRRAATVQVIPPACVLLTVTMATGAAITFMPIGLRSGHTATTALLILGASSLVARWLIGRQIDARGFRALLPVGVVVASLSALLVAWSVDHPHDGSIETEIGAGLLGLGFGACQTSTMVAAFARVPVADVMTASAAWNFGYDAGTACGIGLVSILTSVGLSIGTCLGVTGVLVLACVPIARRVGEGPRVERRPAEMI